MFALWFVFASILPIHADARPVPQLAVQPQGKPAVIPLKELEAVLGKDGWKTDTILPSNLPFPGLDKKELASGVEIQFFWIANPAIPMKTIKVKKGIENYKVSFKGLSIEDTIMIALSRKNGKDVNLSLCKTPRCYDPENSAEDISVTFRSQSMDKEFKVYLVEMAIRIRVRGVERQYYSGSSTVMVFYK